MLPTHIQHLIGLTYDLVRTRVSVDNSLIIIQLVIVLLLYVGIFRFVSHSLLIFIFMETLHFIPAAVDLSNTLNT